MALPVPSLNGRLASLTDYPFTRLASLLASPPRVNTPPLSLALGEPQHAPPPLLAETLAKNAHLWGRYPPVAGTEEFRAAVAGWLTRRYTLKPGAIDAERMILPAAGTREALFQAALLTVPQEKAGARPAVLLPDPFYAVYEGAAVLAGAEPVFVPAGRDTGFLPDFESLPAALLDRTALCYLCSPANPQGAVADLDYLKRLLALARRHGFILAVDECYAEIWDKAPPPGALEAAEALGDEGGSASFANLLVFHSLSKRSSAAGLRSGFIAGEARLIQAFARLRSYALAGNPLPALAAAAALWSDDAHVEENRRLYRQKFDAAEAELAGRFGFYRPPGGFFLWLDVGDGEAAAKRLWEEAAIRVLPGAYLTRHAGPPLGAMGPSPGAAYIRIALVHDAETVALACRRLRKLLS
jgi:N-succinyldiaminopimelate aminotransferase